jgi:DNA-binding response OmpR family regulator
VKSDQASRDLEKTAGAAVWAAEERNHRAGASGVTKIMLVEDDFGIGRFLSRGLAAEGFAVTWVRNGAQTEQPLRSERFEAILLDLGLPDIDGCQLCRNLRYDGIDAPIVMLTARDHLEQKLAGFDAGADDYLSKPFAFEELLARLRAVIGRTSGNGTVQIGRLRLDLRARTASVGGKLLSLPSREFDVLASLARTPGEVVPRNAIIDLAWGVDALVYENTVDVYIGYLRRRLARFTAAVHIETVRGAGFRLIATS